MSIDYQPDSPVRGMVRMADYLRVVRERDELKARLAELLEIDRPVLLAHEVGAGGVGEQRFNPLKAPSAASELGRALTAMRASAAPLSTRDIATALGIRGRQAARALISLCERGYVERADPGPRGRGHRARWRISDLHKQRSEDHDRKKESHSQEHQENHR